MRRVVAQVRAVARALLGHQADADDAAQKALLEILAGARSYRGDGSVEAWARRIAVRTVLRHVRRERRQPSAVTQVHDEPDCLHAPPVASPLEDLPRSVPPTSRCRCA
ncbi:RNA polymerase sigma factor [Nannocystis radixulma]|uniref:Sigma factor n=1 Tax=Nannocystis radixulma TaxID=2995305 RepID=A0ABT5B1P5_9BACT|nr:sigma factor [Nannocystis radixulma]MDC0668006.1 sigma factor [Nannocystis radixulma]